MNIRLPIMICCWWATVGCNISGTKYTNVIPMCYSSILSEEQIKELTPKAEMGNAEAAVKLYRFYDEVLLDHKGAMKWLVIAAENGHTISQYNLGMVYSGELHPETKDLTRAKHWFRIAANRGNEEALRKLKELEN
ncbi:MAG TPA: sel1 repeat family protein [Clostridia bacterium]|nr:sel1 repeat family protein [Clostridia bacterium]